MKFQNGGHVHISTHPSKRVVFYLRKWSLEPSEPVSREKSYAYVAVSSFPGQFVRSSYYDSTRCRPIHQSCSYPHSNKWEFWGKEIDFLIFCSLSLTFFFGSSTKRKSWICTNDALTEFPNLNDEGQINSPSLSWNSLHPDVVISIHLFWCIPSTPSRSIAISMR